nr:ATP-dependent sacrificial sulfur transferase LarE [uncultured Desulfobacter sp.]
MGNNVGDWKAAGQALQVRNENFSRLFDRLKDFSGVAIAFSGGADSAFLLAAARIAGLKTIVPVTVVSDFFTDREKARVARLGRYLSIRPILVPVNILDDAKVARNTDRRCYFCKRFLFSKVAAVAKERGVGILLHGANMDDLQEIRPGMEAARELGFRSPLVEAGFTKEQIRTCSKALGLETWNLPAQSCLATRIPQGDIITKEKLKRVELAEACLHGLGIGQVRVRCHGDLARIEADPDALQDFVHPKLRQKVVQGVKRAGFHFVSLDLEGYGAASRV